MLARGPCPRRAAGMKQVVGCHCYHEQRAVDVDVLVKQQRPDDRNVTENWNRDCPENRGIVERSIFLEHVAADIGG